MSLLVAIVMELVVTRECEKDAETRTEGEEYLRRGCNPDLEEKGNESSRASVHAVGRTGD
jgi:hypothetical protein